jgi:hypothetical protein
MSKLYLTAIVACLGCIFASSQALSLGVTTQDCLDKGKCACVSPTGRVTCCTCPGQARAAQVMFRTPWTVTSPKCSWRRGIFGAWGFVCP